MNLLGLSAGDSFLAGKTLENFGGKHFLLLLRLLLGSFFFWISLTCLSGAGLSGENGQQHLGNCIQLTAPPGHQLRLLYLHLYLLCFLRHLAVLLGILICISASPFALAAASIEFWRGRSCLWSFGHWRRHYLQFVSSLFFFFDGMPWLACFMHVPAPGTGHRYRFRYRYR